MPLCLRNLLVVLVVLVTASCNRPPPAPTGTPISIQSTPSGAAVLVDGTVIGKTPLEGKRLPLGPHMLELRLEGYERHWRPIPAEHPATLDIAATLTPLTSSIYVTSEPKGAFVKLDGSDMGAAPVVLAAVPYGEHEITLSMPGFADQSVAVEVADARPLRIDRSMSTILGTLEIYGEPGGSQVALNGREYGEIPRERGKPLVIPGLAAGPYELTVSKPGYRSRNERVAVTREDVTRVNLEPLDALPGEVHITSDPPQAVVVDLATDAVLGNTPLKLENLPDGILEVRISKAGYESQTSRIVVSHGLFKELDVELRVNSGTMSLITDPPGIEVHIDGKHVGTTSPADNPEVSGVYVAKGLSPGPHRLGLVHPLYERVERSFFIERGKTEHLGTIKLSKVWRPTHVLKLKNGREFKGIVDSRMTDGSIIFERAPNIKVTYKADEIASLTQISTVAP